MLAKNQRGRCVLPDLVGGRRIKARSRCVTLGGAPIKHGKREGLLTCPPEFADHSWLSEACFWHSQSLLSKGGCGSCLHGSSWTRVPPWCYCRHISGKKAVDIASHNALDVKQVSLTISSNAESIGSYKESMLLLLKSMEGGLGKAGFGVCFKEWVCNIKVPTKC